MTTTIIDFSSYRAKVRELAGGANAAASTPANVMATSTPADSKPVKAKPKKRVLTSYPIEDIETFKQVLDEVEAINLPMRLMFEFSARTGLRYSDASKIQFSDVLTPDGEVKERFYIIQQKTGQKLFVAIGDELKDLIIDCRRFSTGDLLFQSTSKRKSCVGKPLTVQYCNRVLKQVQSKLGIQYSISTHSMRKSFACFLLQLDGATIIDVQRRLGHSKVTTTQRYLSKFNDSSETLMKNLSLKF